MISPLVSDKDRNENNQSISLSIDRTVAVDSIAYHIIASSRNTLPDVDMAGNERWHYSELNATAQRRESILVAQKRSVFSSPVCYCRRCCLRPVLMLMIRHACYYCTYCIVHLFAYWCPVIAFFFSYIDNGIWSSRCDAMTTSGGGGELSWRISRLVLFLLLLAATDDALHCVGREMLLWCCCCCCARVVYRIALWCSIIFKSNRIKSQTHR